MGAAPDGGSVGRYELLIELAKGGMAELYVGRLHGVGGFAKLVAIKRILPHLAEDKLFAEMFLNEGRIAAQLAHANVCQVHELGEADGDLFLAMEYLEGVPWSELVKSLPRDTNTLRLAAGVIAQACDGLHYAHELRDLDGNPTPVVHRDVSPQNLFVTTDGTCKVLDFGIAKMLKDGPRTRTGVLKGKLPYMSPEQIQGEEIDARSDVFALGVVLWESLTGKSLFDRETDFLIWKAITEAPIPPLAPFGFPASIDAVIGSALARDKKLRFRSAKALGEALRNAVEPLGGAFDAGDIADLVRVRCGAKLAMRQKEIASAVTRRSKPRIEHDAADTIEDKAGSTTDLAPVKTNAGSTTDLKPASNAGSTVRLRSDAKAVVRSPELAPAPASSAPASSAPASSAPASSEVPVSTSHRSKAPWIIAGGLVLAGVIVAVAVTRPSETSSTPTPEPAPAPVASNGLTHAADTLEAVTGDGRLGKAMDSLDKLAKWGQQMGAVRDSINGSSDPVETAPVETAPVETKPVETKPVETKPVETKPVGTKRSKGSEPAAIGEGQLSVDSSPFATIYIDGKRLGPTPYFNQPIKAGKHELRAVLDDGRSQKRTIVIEDGKTTNLGKLVWVDKP